MAYLRADRTVSSATHSASAVQTLSCVQSLIPPLPCLSVLLCFCRQLELHAQYGKHQIVRIPRFGRDLLYDSSTCDLYVAAASSDVYRLNLEQGRFLAPFTSTKLVSETAVGSTALAQSSVHGLLAVGREDGCVECWDTRDRSSAAILNVADSLRSAGVVAEWELPAWRSSEVSSLCYSDDGLTLAVGMSNGHVLLYDLRSSKPAVVKDHRYGLPVVKVEFHPSTRHVVSTDAKSVRIWDQHSGTAYTAIESAASLHDSTLWPGTGLVMATGEQQRVQVWYIPALGAAPKWCAFLDSLTEELEERSETSVYEDYQFVTPQQLSEWGADHLIGSNVLRAYMHGYFIHAKLYHKLKQAHADTLPAQPAAPTPAALQRLREKTGDRILQRRTGSIKVNAAYADALMATAAVKRRMREAKQHDEDGEADEDEAVAAAAAEERVSDVAANPLGDARFARLFSEEEYKIDVDSEEYKRLHPSEWQKKRTTAGGRRVPVDEEKKEATREEKRAAEPTVDDRFEPVDADDSADNEDDVDQDVDINEDEDEDGRRTSGSGDASSGRKRKLVEREQSDRSRPKRAASMFELKHGFALPSLLQPTANQQQRQQGTAPIRAAEMSLEERLAMLQTQQADRSNGAAGRDRGYEGRETAEASVAGRGGRGRGRGGGRGRDGDRGRGRDSGATDGERRGERRGMGGLLGPDKPVIARGKWAERGRGRGGGARGGGGRGGRGRGRGRS